MPDPTPINGPANGPIGDRVGVPVIVFYDGWCSVCSKSAAKFRSLDARRGLVVCVDLREEVELLEEYELSPSEVRRVLHVITPDGRVLVAMEAVREVMGVLGRGWMVGWTGIVGIRWVVDRLYGVFARHRLRFFGKRGCNDGGCGL